MGAGLQARATRLFLSQVRHPHTARGRLPRRCATLTSLRHLPTAASLSPALPPRLAMLLSAHRFTYTHARALLPPALPSPPAHPFRQAIQFTVVEKLVKLLT
jgi:hypothetical protein